MGSITGSLKLDRKGVKLCAPIFFRVVSSGVQHLYERIASSKGDLKKILKIGEKSGSKWHWSGGGSEPSSRFGNGDG